MKANVLLVVAVIAVLIALVNFSLTLTKIRDINAIFTGLATDTGLVNLTISSEANVNFSTDTINFGSGRVDMGFQNATLYSWNTTSEQGNWSWGSAKYLRLDNIGNVNLTLNLSSDVNAASYLSGTNPVYQWNMTNVDTGACVNTTSTTALRAFSDVTTTQTKFCEPLQFGVGVNTVQIDFFLRVPENSIKGERTSTITATGTA